MSYKNKIKDYKAKVDLEAWQGMESLLDEQAQFKKSNDTKRGFFSNFKKWFVSIGVIVILMAIGIYYFSSNQEQNSLWSENIDNAKSKVENEKRQTSNAELINEKLIESASTDELKSNSKNELNNEIPNSNRSNGAKDTDNAKSSDHHIKKDQIEKSLEKFNKSKDQSRIEEKVANNSKLNNIQNTSTQSDNNNTIPNETNSTSINKDIQKSNIGNTSGQDVSMVVNESNPESSKSISGSSSNPNGELKNDESEVETISIIEVEKIVTSILGSLESNQEVMLGSPDFIIPAKAPSRYMVGLDIGSSQYLKGIAGTSVNVFGVYEVYPWLRAGLIFNRTDLGDRTKFVLSPDIIRKKTETGISLYTQIVPVRVWIFNLGIEGGYGTTYIQDAFRRSENPEPNVIEIREEVINYTSNWFYVGAHFTLDITQSIKIGATVGTNTGTESAHFSGRVVFKI